MSLRPLIRSALALALVTAALPATAARFELQAGRS